jgi:hypothetical protein
VKTAAQIAGSGEHEVPEDKKKANELASMWDNHLQSQANKVGKLKPSGRFRQDKLTN